MCRYFCALENFTFLARSKPVCTEMDMTIIKKKCLNMGFVDHRTKEETKNKSKVYKRSIVRVFASFLKDKSMSCKDTVLPERLLKKNTERNTREHYNGNHCLFRALALHLHCNNKIEEKTSKIFIRFLLSARMVIPQNLEVFTSTTFQKLKT